ncbi:MAG: ATP-dependent Clp protease ATP-binding subunit [Bacilli bacterium]|nr:ATP-dependent Clp protease ATP-binding subunit [Bacilli bacterium]
MFDNYGLQIAEIFKEAENFRKNLKHPYVGTEHLMLALLKYENEVSKKLKIYDLTFEIFKNELVSIVGESSKESELNLYTPLLRRIIETATEDAIDNNNGEVTERHLFLALLEEGEGIAIRIMIGLDIDLDSLYEEFKMSLVKNAKNKLELMEIGNNLNKNVSNFEHVVGREEEIALVIEALLRKKKSNPLLIGKAGVGKTAIVEELARRINNNIVPAELENKTIVMLEMGALVAGTKYRGEFEERLNKIIKEVKDNKNIILFIDEIHTMINAGGAEGAINAADILKPYLARGEIKCIGATTTDEYYKSIYKDKALERRFYLIQVEEPSLEKTKNILKKIKKEYENHHHLTISNENIEDIVELADKYIKNKSNPDKSIDLLDMICASKKVKNIHFEKLDQLNQELEEIKKQKKEFIYQDDYEQATLCKEKENQKKQEIQATMVHNASQITYQDIIETLEQKSNIPLLENKKEIFSLIKNNLETKIFGQEKALNKILKNIWIKLCGEEKPLAILLAGPSGVGKTETVKTVAKSIKKSNFIRLDMSEYNLEGAVNKLIGVSAGFVGYNDKYLFRSVLDNPYSVILVDEIEKAHPSVLNLFLQILDEGFITNANNEKIDFSHAMIFMTSNVTNHKYVGFTNTENNNLVENFSKEFLGRFTDIVTYENLREDVLKKYVDTHLTNKKVNFEKIKNEADCDKYGLRNLKAIIQKYNHDLDIEIAL